MIVAVGIVTMIVMAVVVLFMFTIVFIMLIMVFIVVFFGVVGPGHVITMHQRHRAFPELLTAEQARQESFHFRTDPEDDIGILQGLAL